MDWKANKYEFNWATLQKQAKDTNDTNQRIWGLKVLKFVSPWRKRGSHKQTNPLDDWLSTKQWAGERGDPGRFLKNFSPNPNAESECLQCLSMCNIISLKWPPVAPFATGQLRTKCFDSRNLGTNLDPWMHQSGQSINLPQETIGQQHASLTLAQNCKRWNLWFGHASCGPTRSCLPHLANKLGAFAGREGVSTSVSRRSWCECSNLWQLEVLELTQMNFGEKLQELLFDGECSSDELEIPNMRSPTSPSQPGMKIVLYCCFSLG